MKNKKRKNTFLSFNIGKEIFAVSVTKVLEVLQTQHITEIPNVPEFIKGVINFRGNIIPVVEARTKFNMPQREDSEKYVIIVFVLNINNKNVIIGAKADNVRDVIAIEDHEVQDIPELGLNYNTEFLHGMLKGEKGFVMILNIDKIFSVEEVSILKNNAEDTNEIQAEETAENA
ncbi:MAG: chemotaxis protein CheW [bacterium]|nr:chemotaxis protein CheW [bacterium]